eukprot:CAMPEP_0172424348 /NCGR_PEP_ID=MMETSP1064-20121228/24443_1 /TAXON_ID=202472 /ORGANISM="Aulacoseira subarctica , Strain CCAP 1002/5" /LENGTH=77 /DNA_ID=CAMNT_0013166353 /DNA_START=520 /DNA_END=753 /DNA_ORIENTATION=+
MDGDSYSSASPMQGEAVVVKMTSAAAVDTNLTISAAVLEDVLLWDVTPLWNLDDASLQIAGATCRENELAANASKNS